MICEHFRIVFCFINIIQINFNKFFYQMLDLIQAM
jgi:hypothetical protein